MHLRNTLAKGMDAESYSLHTFEALLSQSMENLGNIFVRISVWNLSLHRILFVLYGIVKLCGLFDWLSLDFLCFSTFDGSCFDLTLVIL